MFAPREQEQFLGFRRKIVCAGASMGGTACLRVAIDDKPFIGLIILASTMAVKYNELRILPEEMVGLTQPKLFITAEDDFYLVVQDTNRMYDLSPEPKKLLLLAGIEHGTDLFQTGVGEELTGAMLDFLDGLSKSAQILPAPTIAEDTLPPPRVMTTANARDVVLLRTLQIPGFSQSAISQCSVAFSPDGRLLSGVCYKNTLPIWDVQTDSVQGANQKANTDSVYAIVGRNRRIERLSRC